MDLKPLCIAIHEVDFRNHAPSTERTSKSHDACMLVACSCPYSQSWQRIVALWAWPSNFRDWSYPRDWEIAIKCCCNVGVSWFWSALACVSLAAYTGSNTLDSPAAVPNQVSLAMEPHIRARWKTYYNLAATNRYSKKKASTHPAPCGGGKKVFFFRLGAKQKKPISREGKLRTII